MGEYPRCFLPRDRLNLSAIVGYKIETLRETTIDPTFTPVQGGTWVLSMSRSVFSGSHALLSSLRCEVDGKLRSQVEYPDIK